MEFHLSVHLNYVSLSFSEQEADHIQSRTSALASNSDARDSDRQTYIVNRKSANETSQDHTHHPSHTTPTACYQRPLRCSNLLSMSTSRLFNRKKRTSSGRHRLPMPTTQSLDEGFIVVDKSELRGYSEADHTSPHFSPSSSCEASPSHSELSTNELSNSLCVPRQRSRTVPCDNGGVVSPHLTLPGSAHLTPEATPLSPDSSPKLIWTFKRVDFLEPIFKHTSKSFSKCFKMKAGGRRGLTLDLKLYPNGVNWAADKSVSLQVKVATPSSHASSSLYLSVLVEEIGLPHVLVNRKKVCKLREEREFLMEEFISHDVLKTSKAKSFQLMLTAQLCYHLGEDWVSIGSDNDLGCSM